MTPLNVPVPVGTRLYGPCGGVFGTTVGPGSRLEVVASGWDWVVVRSETGAILTTQGANIEAILRQHIVAPPGAPRRDLILDTTQDLASQLLERDNDEELSTDDVYGAFQEGEVTIEEIVGQFEAALRERLE